MTKPTEDRWGYQAHRIFMVLVEAGCVLGTDRVSDTRELYALYQRQEMSAGRYWLSPKRVTRRMKLLEHRGIVVTDTKHRGGWLVVGIGVPEIPIIPSPFPQSPNDLS